MGRGAPSLRNSARGPGLTPPSPPPPPLRRPEPCLHALPDLHPRPQLSGSQLSLSGEAEAGAVQVCGSVHFALRYEPGTAELRVHVIQCQGLAAARRRRSDP